MTLPPLTHSRGQQLISRLGGLRILVVGDVMLDGSWWAP
jgi:bifunctional ADP-heptose synthase (sugar kinase/adenylyltransferase)